MSAHTIVTTDIKDRLLGAAERRESGLTGASADRWDDGDLWIVRLFGVGEGQLSTVLHQDGTVHFKPYTSDFWEC